MTDHSITRFLATQGADLDPAETAEWRDAFLALVATQGPERARFMLDALVRMARTAQVEMLRWGLINLGADPGVPVDHGLHPVGARRAVAGRTRCR